MTEPRQDTVEKVELLPCPICNGPARLLVRGGAAGVQCRGKTHLIWAYGTNAFEATENWNTRAAINAMSDVREALDWRQVQIETRRHAGRFVDRADIEAVLKGIAALNSLSGGGK